MKKSKKILVFFIIIILLHANFVISENLEKVKPENIKEYNGEDSELKKETGPAPVYGTEYTHQYIAREAGDIWKKSEFNSYLSSNYISYDPISGNKNDIIEGAYEEDSIDGCKDCEFGSYLNHFWEVDNPESGSYNDGISEFDSAYVTAQYYWDNYVIPYYSSDKAKSYYYLGRVAHLITDMGVPAHTHLDEHIGSCGWPDDESLECFMEDFGDFQSGLKNYLYFDGSDYYREQYNYESVYFNSNAKSNPSDLFKLFWYATQKTQYYASDGEYGNDYYAYENGNCLNNVNCYWLTNLWNGDGVIIIDNPSDIEDFLGSANRANLKKVSSGTIPHSMKAVAGLYRLFWIQTHNLRPCTSGSCCDTSFDITKESGSQPTGYSDEYICKNDDKHYRDYYCSGTSTSSTYSETFNQDCGVDHCNPWGSNFCENEDVYKSRYCWDNGCSSGSCFTITNTEKEKVQECGDNSCNSWGSNYCSNGDVYHSRTCYDKGCSSGSCFNNGWTDTDKVQECGSLSCSSGQCTGGGCSSHNSYKCYSNDIYWYDSCGVREDVKQDCGSAGCTTGATSCSSCSSHSSYKCYSNDIYWYNSCGVREDVKQDCGSAGCTTGATSCSSCSSHSSYKCYSNDIYWYNSCGVREDVKQDCGSAGCTTGATSCDSEGYKYITGDFQKGGRYESFFWYDNGKYEVKYGYTMMASGYLYNSAWKLVKPEHIEKLYVGDFDGDGADEIVALQNTGGLYWMYVWEVYDNSGWWKGYPKHSGPLQNSVGTNVPPSYITSFLVADYGRDGVEELSGYQTGWFYVWRMGKTRPYASGVN
ncbi:MAG: hypothetical protein KKF56_00415 [Nanoarchaeota archaeon]|nr:hypothetical protein [Nanoarchaeota archaeon]